MNHANILTRRGNGLTFDEAKQVLMKLALVGLGSRIKHSTEAHAESERLNEYMDYFQARTMVCAYMGVVPLKYVPEPSLDIVRQMPNVSAAILKDLEEYERQHHDHPGPESGAAP